MRIEYTLTYRDWMLFSFTHQFLSPWLQFLYLGMTILIYLTSAGESPSDAGIVAVVCFVLMWIFQFGINAVYALGRNKALLTQHVVELHDDAFYDETVFGRSFHYWPGIAKVVRRPGFAAVYLNALSAHIIPRRAFASDAQIKDFVATIKERMRGAAVKPG